MKTAILNVVTNGWSIRAAAIQTNVVHETLKRKPSSTIRRSEPTGRSLRQRSPFAERCSITHRRIVPSRDKTL
ncbi:hypothetical protein JTB14_015713 [Gonioctena quinquepunctata]|nr:hypothetical protein JTB14_015713 [Gonioctena quinquepunctata]